MQLLPYLAAVCREIRIEAGVGPAKVAGEAGYSASTSISRTFEGAVAWPNNPDRVVGAYATTCNVTVASIWQEAIRRAEAAAEEETDADRAGRAAAAARKAGAAMRKAREQSPEQQRPTGAQRRTG